VLIDGSTSRTSILGLPTASAFGPYVPQKPFLFTAPSRDNIAPTATGPAHRTARGRARSPGPGRPAHRCHRRHARADTSTSSTSGAVSPVAGQQKASFILPAARAELVDPAVLLLDYPPPNSTWAHRGQKVAAAMQRPSRTARTTVIIRPPAPDRSPVLRPPSPFRPGPGGRGRPPTIRASWPPGGRLTRHVCKPLRSRRDPPTDAA